MTSGSAEVEAFDAPALVTAAGGSEGGAALAPCLPAAFHPGQPHCPAKRLPQLPYRHARRERGQQRRRWVLSCFYGYVRATWRYGGSLPGVCPRVLCLRAYGGGARRAALRSTPKPARPPVKPAGGWGEEAAYG